MWLYIVIWVSTFVYAAGVAGHLLWHYFLVYLERQIGTLQGPGADYFHRVRGIWVPISAFFWPISLPYAAYMINYFDRKYHY